MDSYRGEHLLVLLGICDGVAGFALTSARSDDDKTGDTCLAGPCDDLWAFIDGASIGFLRNPPLPGGSGNRQIAASGRQRFGNQHSCSQDKLSRNGAELGNAKFGVGAEKCTGATHIIGVARSVLHGFFQQRNPETRSNRKDISSGEMIVKTPVPVAAAPQKK